MQASEVTLVWSFRNRLDILKQSIVSADNCFPKAVNFCLVDAASSDETIKSLRELANSIPDRQIRICESAYRSSLSEAWNLGMMLCNTRYVIFASSDVDFHSKLILDYFSEAKRSTLSKYILLENHAVFLLDKKIIKSVGWFDESFVLGPHFDCDYMIRATEVGEKIVVLDKNINGISSYSHYDSPEVVIQRTSTEVPDRLPMHDYTNDRVFKEKWQSNWPGWEDYAHVSAKPHPPTNISQALRMKKEIDPHPFYTIKDV